MIYTVYRAAVQKMTSALNATVLGDLKGVGQSYHQTYPQKMWKTFILYMKLVSEYTLRTEALHCLGASGQIQVIVVVDSLKP